MRQREGIMMSESRPVRPAVERGTTEAALPAGRIVGESGVMLWGMTSAERIARAFSRAGIAQIAAGHLEASQSNLLVRADYVLDEVLIRDLASAPATLLLASDGRTPVAAHCHVREAERLAPVLERGEPASADVAAALHVVRPGELSSRYRMTLRKREEPYALPLKSCSLREIERRMFDGSYKGVTDIVTKYVWPRPALWATRWLAAAHVSPNAVTSAGVLLVLAACWLFLEGRFTAGLAAAWLMTFLDTVDGKLARVTLTSTRLGDLLDHGVDLVHPPFWYFAWVAGLAATGYTIPAEPFTLAVIIGGYILGRIQEGLFVWLAGFQMHVWQPIDSRFRLITARRNPNLVILTLFAVIGRPDLGIIGVAIWTGASIVFHSVRLVQAVLARWRSGPLTSWLSAPS